MRSLLFYLRVAVTCGAAGVVLLHATSASSLMAGCHATPAQTIETGRSSAEGAASTSGYRLEAVRWDPLLQQRWALVSICGRPDLPHLMLPLQRATTRDGISTTPFPVVHVGDVVHIVSQEEFMRMELTGIAEENGVLGARVRVHLLQPGAIGAPPTQTVFNSGNRSMQVVIRGPHEAEIDR